MLRPVQTFSTFTTLFRFSICIARWWIRVCASCASESWWSERASCWLQRMQVLVALVVGRGYWWSCCEERSRTVTVWHRHWLPLLWHYPLAFAVRILFRKQAEQTVTNKDKWWNDKYIYMYASCLAGTGCALSLGWVCKLMNPFWLKSEPNWLHRSFFCWGTHATSRELP